MQTAAASSKEIQEGIEAGVYYYLTKPFEPNIMMAIVKSAIQDNVKTKQTIDDANIVYRSYDLIKKGEFEFRTLQDVSSLAFLTSNFCYNPNDALIGIHELMMNAIEHGNLGIDFEEKKQLMLDDCYFHEIEKRLQHKEFLDKRASLYFDKQKDFITITIEDMGNGFDPEPFMEFNLDRATCPNGRGIVMAKTASFNSLEYNKKGNKVTCKILLI